MLEYIKIEKNNETTELQLSSKYQYSIVGNKLERKEKEFNAENFFSPKIENIFALVGANGSGKTSLIYSINSILNEKANDDPTFKYILIINDKNQLKIKTYNIQIEYSLTLFKRLEKKSLEQILATAIYHLGLDGNSVASKASKNTVDLSLNYKFQNSNYKSFREESVFNQLSVISQHPNLLTKIGIEKLNHPKEVSYSLNLDHLNNTTFKFYMASYLVYIYSYDYIDLYYELDNLLNEEHNELSNINLDSIVGFLEKRLILCTLEELKNIEIVSSKLKITIIKVELTELFRSYSRAAINEVNRSLESKYDVSSNFLNDIGIYYFERVFMDFFQYLINHLDIKSMVDENIFYDYFTINIDNLIEDIVNAIEDLNFLCKHFQNEMYIEKLILNNEVSYSDLLSKLYFEKVEEIVIQEFKSRLYSNITSEKRDLIISQLQFTNEGTIFLWEESIDNFFTFMRKILLPLIKKNIKLDGSTSEDSLLNFGVKSISKDPNIKYSKKILKEILSNINKSIKNKTEDTFASQKKSIEDLVKLMKMSKPTRYNDKLLTIDINSEYIRDFFKVYKGNFADCIFKFEWRNMSSGEFAILNLLSNVYRINYNIKSKNCLILFIDEGDLYLHPQWQKQFLYILIKSLEDLLEFSKIYLLVTTHSPFLVSDLPKENILFLNPISDDDYTIENTFAANINELLATKFFIQDGLIGKLAKEKINELYEEITNNFDIERIEDYKNVIEIIGEPLVKSKLVEILNDEIYEYNSKISITESLKRNNLEFSDELLNKIYTKLRMELDKKK